MLANDLGAPAGAILSSVSVGDGSNLKLGEDGSLTIDIQAQSPAPTRKATRYQRRRRVQFKRYLRLDRPPKRFSTGVGYPPGGTEGETSLILLPPGGAAATMARAEVPGAAAGAIFLRGSSRRSPEGTR